MPANDNVLTVALPDALSFAGWRASYAERDDHFAETVEPLAQGGDPEGQAAMDEAVFSAPPSGEWLLEVRIWLAEGAGSISYYWQVAVP